MRTIAFSTDTEKMSWLIVDGSHSEPQLVSTKLERIKFPVDIDEGAGLLGLIKTLGLLIDAQNPKQIAILQPGKSKFNNASPIRFKVEAALQVAAVQKGIAVCLVSPLTVSAYKKKLAKAEKTIEGLVNGGQPFSPRETGDVICAGVVRLPNV
ncbi:hypothetical protein [Granulicella arctica]|uniref:Uncharacterized protein n=1 Tax=Granulicella arctica TaxID=940613 RepID=A0A7Y9TL60_9BACT|nr:hypothetical protein [Granulicella arctica]NYF79827.1 hypothetical protein [Granulicella arctica]